MALGLTFMSGDAFAQTYPKTETIEYNHDLSLWVLGQVERVTVNGVEAQRTDFGWKALPWKTYSFGKLQQTFSYDSTSTVASGQLGTLKTISDGRDGALDTTITVSSWKRGIPQTIKYPGTPESPTGATESAFVNDDGTIAWIVAENGSKTCYGYDPMGRLASITYPSEVVGEEALCNANSWNVTTQTFAPVAANEYGIGAGHWKQTVSTGNGRKVTYFDAMWRPLVEESYDNASPTTTRSLTVKRYDLGGRLEFQSYALGSLTSYADTTLKGTFTTYDALDRVTGIKQNSEHAVPLDVLTTTIEYQPGFQTRVTNPRGFATTTSYLVYDQPTTDWPLAVTHPEGAYTHITRDVFGKPTRLRRSNSSSPTGGTIALDRIYTYNGSQELCRTDEPETGSSFMGYDAAGNLAWSASGYSTVAAGCMGATSVAARRIDRTYDARNRVTALTFPDGRGNQSWSYTSDGLPEQIITYNAPNLTAPVINAYSYNRRRMLNGQGESISQTGWYTWGIGYGYDRNGNLASHVYPDDLAVTYLPNALGQPTQVGTYATGVSYYPNGALKQFTYGNGIVHTLSQNVRGLPDVSKDAYGTTSFLNDAYDYDPNANVAAITDGATGRGQRGNRTMTYDGLDRLKKTVSPMYGTVGANYAYDVLDNLTQVNAGGAGARNHYYCYDTAWQLTNVKTGSCSGTSVIGLGYDAQGNLNNKNGQVFTFDFGNRLRSVGSLESYRYDGHGRRVLANNAAGNILSQYSFGGQLFFQSDVRVGLSKAYMYLGGSLVAVREQPLAGGTAITKYQHTDALGSPVAVTNASRIVLEQNEYEPFGKVIAPAAPHDGPGYTGHVFDAATGMNYMQQRYYDPTIGRFLSVDPVTADGNTGGNFNRYWYAANNPYKFTDPDGRDITCAGNRCALVPIGGNLPTINFPRPEGFPAKINAQDSTFHHAYKFSDSAGKGDANYGQKVNNQLVQNPTPMENKPATLQGNKIDVNANNAISRMTGQDNVMSYKVPLPGGGNAVLNVTTGDHAATWGIVLRTTEAGPGGTQNIITYGEGDSFLQRTFDPNNNQSREVWTKSAEDITRRAQQP